ncbi:hypothetical protein [Nostoc sp.]|uniref:hypothetical protein n=1 Tax=Nostoc sp. TaxID=1180 RepID=UPI002FF7956E
MNQKPNILLQITNYFSKSSPYSPSLTGRLTANGHPTAGVSLSRMGKGETMPRNERDYELQIGIMN